ncbi:transcriptional regulator with XRE-family HTH domain [Aureimonas phyllosphaerae]|uniref:Transcriptional regulator with XRE-family HTH domain n=2 Tax=Aureimonas phyllosphaerae TaxID=1166078 RepID=A0A7W6FW98_9HYPH|nr:transcriptional regulator with XRE-family HTH domain [Aureimonas phyllosphaerae]MBB3962005.1 transcriptional regulator with XRE-family HTH domain [Aureimonas phyllosphaerae]
MTMTKNERDPIDVHVGARLRLVRTSRRLSLEELGRQIGVTYQQIQKYETGSNRISAATLYRISQLFEISPTFFFEGLTSQGETDEAATPSPEVVQSSLALGRIPDGEIRHRLRLLIDALAPSRDN